MIVRSSVSLVATVALAVPAALAAQDTTHVHRLDTLQVTAERRPAAVTATPAIVRVITSDEWRQRGAGDLTTLLRDIPGVQLDPVVGAGDGISVEGLGSDRVQILIDGAPVEGRLNNQFDITRLDPAQFDRVEIVEGPQSTLYGSTALGGVINLISRTPGAQRAEITTEGGSYGQFDVTGRVSTMIGSAAVSVDGGHRHIGIVPGDAVGTPGSADRWDGMARVITGIGSSTLDIRAMHTSEQQLYQQSFGPGFTFANNARNEQTDVLGVIRFHGDATELRAHASVYDHTLGETDLSSQSTTEDPQAQRLADLELIRHGNLDRTTWVAGIRGEHEWITTARLTDADESSTTGALYASTETPLSHALALSTGLRATVAQRWGTDIAPRLGLVWHATRAVYAKLSGAHGFRAPSFTEQFSNFTNAEQFYAVTGNPDLKPESSWNVSGEVGVKHRNAEAYVRGFANRLRNFIEADYTGQQGDIAEFTYLNVGRARTDGAEVGGRVSHGIATLEGSYAYLDARDEVADQPLLGRAAHTVRGAFTLAKRNLSVTAEAVRLSAVPISQDMTTGALIYEGASPRVNLRAHAALLRMWEANAGVDNVGNVVPENAIAGFGRRWFAGLTWGRS